jgi:hypothetical protein
MKRREFLRNVAATAGMAAAGIMGIDAPEAAEQSPAGKDTSAAKIVLIGHKPDHPPGTHLYLRECGLLAKCLQQTPGVTAVVSDGWPRESAILDGASAIVIYSSPGAEIIFRPDHADQAEAFLKRGVGLTALHWATGIADAKNNRLADRYLRALGGLFGFGWSGLDISTSRVEPVLPGHPVSRGWGVYDLKDEWYLDLKFLPEAKPLAKVRVKGKEQVVAWVCDRKDSAGGRSYGNTLGHFHENFGIEPFRKAIVNGVLWTAHRDIPVGGAPCAITAEDMRL